tara:strand:+ start:1852 stop:2874 length:1023 start_codon:yes stop_codon:yes gene_type:complete
MKKFITKCTIFSIIITTFSIWINNSVPFYWANKGVDQKIKHIKENDIKYNTLFWGSSRTQMHIYPKEFDKEMRGITKSFNLGYSSCRAEELIFLLEEFIDKETNLVEDLDFVFLEIRPIFYDEKTLFTSRGKYCLNKKSKNFLLNYYENSNLEYARKDINKAFIEKKLGIGVLRDKIAYLVRSLFQNENNLIGENGFLNRKKAIVLDHINHLLSNHREDSLKILSTLQKRKHFAEACFEKQNRKLNLNEKIYLKKLNSINDKLNEKGVKLVLFPTLRFQNSNIIALIKKANAVKIIDISNPSIHPEYYDYQLSGDASHLNIKGARMYSQDLAKGLKENLK